MGTRLIQVDAFAEAPFRGNPAAVCLLDGPREDAWMQAVALEMNLSETAFLLPEGERWRLRWFTPAVEVDLCGHATLASAHALWEEGRAPEGTSLRFLTRSGELRADRRDGLIELDFPATPVEPAEPPPALLAALKASPRFAGRSRFDWLVLLEGEPAVRTLGPDFRALAAVTERGLIATAPSDSPEFDFVSRFFAPAAGIAEDPVTGSAHCALGPFWAERLGKPELRAFQASRRGGSLRVRLSGDRVLLGGRAVTTLRGEIVV